MSPGIEKTDMQWEVNACLCIVGAEQIKSMPEIESFLVAVPPPVSIRIGEAAFTGTVWDAVFHASADFMPIGGGVGMDTGTIAGKGKAVCGDEPVPEGREDSGETEELLEPFFIMEGKFLMFQGVSRQGVRNTGMFVGKFLPFAGFFGRF